MGHDKDSMHEDVASVSCDASSNGDDSIPDLAECHELVVDGILDLHMFSPRDIKILIPDYLDECRDKGILTVRIIHGKGTGTLRRTVHSILGKVPYVVSYSLAPEREGGWGATVVGLKPCEDEHHRGE